MSIGCLSISFFHRAPCLLSPILQSPHGVSEALCASENEPSQLPIKIRKQSPSLCPVLHRCCNGSTSLVTHFKVSQTVQCKGHLTTSLSHSIWSYITCCIFHLPLSLPLPLCPAPLYKQKPLWNSAVRPWGRWMSSWQLRYLWKPPCGSQAPCAWRTWASLTLPVFHLTTCKHASISSNTYSLYTSPPMLSHPYFSGLLHHSQFIARKDLCWWLNLVQC